MIYTIYNIKICGQTKIREIEKQERKILRKIYGPICLGSIWNKRPTSELYKHTQTITVAFRKRRMTFYGHIYRMNQNRLTRRIFNIINSSKNKLKWITEIEEDLKQLGITKEAIKDRQQFRNLIKKCIFKQNPMGKNTGMKWSDERKKEHSERMKRVWEERRSGRRS